MVLLRMLVLAVMLFFAEKSLSALCPNGKPVTSKEFLCHDHRKCILKRWVCDGPSECNDNSDESNCQTTPRFNFSAMVLPTATTNVPMQAYATSESVDGTLMLASVDSRSKPATNNATPTARPSTQHKMKVVPTAQAKQKNGVLCPNGKPVTSKEFRCHDDKKCILKRWVCDGHSECDDNSDESNCQRNVTRSAIEAYRQSESCKRQRVFVCVNYHVKNRPFQCFPRDYLCDRQSDCDEGQDEMEELCNLPHEERDKLEFVPPLQFNPSTPRSNFSATVLPTATTNVPMKAYATSKSADSTLTLASADSRSKPATNNATPTARPSTQHKVKVVPTAPAKQKSDSSNDTVYMIVGVIGLAAVLVTSFIIAMVKAHWHRNHESNAQSQNNEDLLPTKVCISVEHCDKPKSTATVVIASSL